MNDATSQQFLDQQQSLAGLLSGAGTPWLDALRAHGREQLSASGFPSVRDEAWRYTNTRPILKPSYQVKLTQDAPLSNEAIAATRIPDLNAQRVVLVNGIFNQQLSTLSALPEGVRVQSINQVLANDPDSISPFLNQQLPATTHGFNALNTALLHDGVWIDIDPDITVTMPIELLNISVVNDDQILAIMPRFLITAAESSRCSVVERYLVLGEGKQLTNVITEVNVASGAVVDHYKLQQESEQGYHIASLYADVLANGELRSHNLELGGAIARNEILINLTQPGAHCVMNGLYLGAGRQHIDNYTQVEHVAPHCTSDEFYKGVLDGRSRAVFHGRIVVHQDAQKTDAKQQNRNLLLSPNAEIDTKPQLEIYADDVKCAHGVTVGQLDDEALFYLRSRAIDKNTARRMLTFAFANEVINRMDNAAIRDYLEKQLHEKYSHEPD